MATEQVSVLERFDSVEALRAALGGRKNLKAPGIVRVNPQSLGHSHSSAVVKLRAFLREHGFVLVLTSAVPLGKAELWHIPEACASANVA
jgi:hypothetical protein